MKTIPYLITFSFKATKDWNGECSTNKAHSWCGNRGNGISKKIKLWPNMMIALVRWLLNWLRSVVTEQLPFKQSICLLVSLILWLAGCHQMICGISSWGIKYNGSFNSGRLLISKCGASNGLLWFSKIFGFPKIDLIVYCVLA